MKRFVAIAALGTLLAASSLLAQDAKPRTYSLVLQGAV